MKENVERWSENNRNLFCFYTTYSKLQKREEAKWKFWGIKWVVCEMKKTKCPCKIKISVLFVSLLCANLYIFVKSREESKFTY